MGAPAQAPARYKTSYTEQITKVKVFKLSENVVSMIFFRLKIWNLDFDLKVGFKQPSREKYDAPPLKSTKKTIFQTIKIWISIVGMDSLTQDLYPRT